MNLLRQVIAGAARRRAAVEQFDAASLTNLIHWLRADEVVTSGSAVTEWTDKSSAEKSASQTESANRPTIATTYGKPAVAFNGTDQWLDFSGYLYGANEADTFIAVLAAGSRSGGRQWYMDRGTTSGFRSNGTDIIPIGANRTNGPVVPSADFSLSGWNIFAVSYAGAGDFFVRLNGKTLSQSGSTRWNTSGTLAYIGRGASGYFSGSIGEIIRYSGAKSVGDVQTAEEALAGYYGITLHTP